MAANFREGNSERSASSVGDLDDCGETSFDVKILLLEGIRMRPCLYGWWIPSGVHSGLEKALEKLDSTRRIMSRGRITEKSLNINVGLLCASGTAKVLGLRLG